MLLSISPFSCSLYNRGKNCVMKHVASQCGDEDAKILNSASHLFSRLIPERCSHVSGASSLSVTLVAIVSLIAAFTSSLFM